MTIGCEDDMWEVGAKSYDYYEGPTWDFYASAPTFTLAACRAMLKAADA